MHNEWFLFLNDSFVKRFLVREGGCLTHTEQIAFMASHIGFGVDLFVRTPRSVWRAKARVGKCFWGCHGGRRRVPRAAGLPGIAQGRQCGVAGGCFFVEVGLRNNRMAELQVSLWLGMLVKRKSN